ncbi:MAG: nucleotidyltransferase family protein [Pseudomonadota bacterium]|nr:nucleotidyltransferase family protein [Pseudomonadota bacterium]
MKAIVLAGGLGTRLARVTSELPKPMAPIGSRPFLEYLLDYLVEQGTEQAVLAVSHKWEVIRGYFGDTYRGMSLNYSLEEEPLGTGGAIRQALETIPDDEVIVLNGDTLFHLDLEAFAAAHHRGKVLLTIALKQVADCGRFGRVKISDNGVITEFLEKSTNGSGWINGGIYMLNRRLLVDFPMPVKFSFEQDLIEPNIACIRPVAFQSNAYFIDIGVPEDYERAQSEIGC